MIGELFLKYLSDQYETHVPNNSNITACTGICELRNTLHNTSMLGW